MPVVPHRFVREPADPDAALWRYGDLWKLEALLGTGRLYFTRANRAGDPLEGSYTVANIDSYRQIMVQLHGQYGQQLVDKLPAWNRAMTGWIYLSCWFMQPHESQAMWDGFGKGPAAERVAFRTTIGGLKGSIVDQKEIHLGEIRYIDFATQRFERGHALPPFLHKAMHLDSEHEVRAIYAHPLPVRYLVDDPPLTSGPEGVEIAVDLAQLLQEVVVAPGASVEFRARVQNLTDGAGLHLGVRHSAIDNPPLY